MDSGVRNDAVGLMGLSPAVLIADFHSLVQTCHGRLMELSKIGKLYLVELAGSENVSRSEIGLMRFSPAMLTAGVYDQKMCP